MKPEILEQLTWKDIMEIHDVASEEYYVSSDNDSDEEIYTRALNRLKEQAK